MNKALLDTVLKTDTNNLVDLLIKHLKSKSYHIRTDYDNFILAYPNGNTDKLPLLVSHIDTIREMRTKTHDAITHNDIYYFTTDNNPLGADDRAGVFIILQLIEYGYQLPVLFTNYEESGGKGVKEFCKTEHIEYIKDKVNVMIEYDRRGVNQYVYYSYSIPDELKKVLEEYGFTEEHGSYSDVSTLTDYTGIAHANLSAGYVNEHTKYERLYINYLEFILNTSKLMMKELIELPQLTVDEYEYYDIYKEIYNDIGGLNLGDYAVIEDLLYDTCHVCKVPSLVCECDIDTVLDQYLLTRRERKRLKRIIKNIRKKYKSKYEIDDGWYRYYGSWY